MPGKSIALLDQCFASAVDLHGLVKIAHWNVRMRGFTSLTDLLGKVVVEVAFIVNRIDERLGGPCLFERRLGEYSADRSQKVQYKRGISDGQRDILNVYKSLTKFAKSIASANAEAVGFGDLETAGLFAEISQVIDQQLWLVKAGWVQNQSIPTFHAPIVEK